MFVFERVALPLVPLCDGDLDQPVLLRCFEHGAGNAGGAEGQLVGLVDNIFGDALTQAAAASGADPSAGGGSAHLLGYRRATVRELLRAPPGASLELDGTRASSAGETFGALCVRDARRGSRESSSPSPSRPPSSRSFF